MLYAGTEQGARSEMIDGIIVRGFARACQSGNVIHYIHITQQRSERFCIAEIRDGYGNGQVGTEHPIPGENADVPSACYQCFDEVASYKAGSSGDECFHD
jgi:hypothetical protein